MAKKRQDGVCVEGARETKDGIYLGENGGRGTGCSRVRSGGSASRLPLRGSSGDTVLYRRGIEGRGGQAPRRGASPGACTRPRVRPGDNVSGSRRVQQ